MTGRVIVRAFDGQTLVNTAIQSKTGSVEKITVAADRITRIVINAPARTGIYDICWLTVLDCADSIAAGWQHLGYFKLPASWAEASIRIPTSMHARYRPSYSKMQEVINLPSSGASYQDTSQSPSPRFRVFPAHICLWRRLIRG